MKFRLIPVIDLMLDLYSKPLAPERFQEYLKLLQGESKRDLSLSLGGYNPMAKDYAVSRLQELKALGAEHIADEVSQDLNHRADLPQTGKTIGIAITLSDDLKGGWTNRYTSDYDSKFRADALLNRNFCTPVFWTSEAFSQDMIRQRASEYAWRAIYRQSHQAPETLQEHLEQETFVAQQTQAPAHASAKGMALAEELYQQHRTSDDYHSIFNFLYGSKASASLAFPLRFELEDFAGYRYAAWLANA